MINNKFIFIINSFIELNELYFLIKFLIKKKKKFDLIVLKRKGPQQQNTKLNKNKINRFFGKPTNIIFANKYEDIFVRVNKANSIVISTHPYNHLFQKKQKKFFFILFQSVLDTFNHASLDGLKKADLIFLHTKMWKEHIKKLFATTTLKFKDKFFYYGYKKLYNEKKNKIYLKKKYKFKNKKKIILLLHGNFNRMSSIFNHVYTSRNILEMIFNFIFSTIKFKFFCFESLKIILKKVNYKKFIDALEDFKLKNNCYLITKYRSKFIPPDYVRNVSDIVVDDKKLFPQPSISLSKISDLIIHFNSTGIFEAVNFNVPLICILKPSNLTIDKNSITYKTHKITRPKNKKSIFNFKSINPTFDVESIIEALKDSKSKNFFKFNKNHYFDYKKKFIRDNKELSPQEIYNLILKKYKKHG